VNNSLKLASASIHKKACFSELYDSREPRDCTLQRKVDSEQDNISTQPRFVRQPRVTTSCDGKRKALPRHGIPSVMVCAGTVFGARRSVVTRTHYYEQPVCAWLHASCFCPSPSDDLSMHSKQRAGHVNTVPTLHVACFQFSVRRLTLTGSAVPLLAIGPGGAPCVSRQRASERLSPPRAWHATLYP
jgi:hypothetical protein